MYTMPQKLAETIALQQRLLREAMVEQAHMLRTSAEDDVVNREWNDYSNDGRRGGTGRPEASGVKQFQDQNIPELCEWKVGKAYFFHFH